MIGRTVSPGALRRLTLALVTGVVWSLAAAAPRLLAQESTVVILVRHAEKAAEPAADPPLTPAGEARAQALAAALAGTRLDGIVTTQYLRTRATAEPIARAKSLTAEVVRGGVQAVADHVRQRYAGRTVLVVGHSNTIPAIIGALGGPRMPDLCDPEYAHLFVLVIRADGGASLVDAGVGAADAPDAAACRR